METILIVITGFAGIVLIIGIPLFIQHKDNKEIFKKKNPAAYQGILQWEISAEEQKEWNKRAILKTFLYSFPLLIISGFSVWFKNGKEGIGTIVFFETLIVSGFGIAYIANLFAKHNGRTYLLDKESIVLTRGNESGSFKWKDFEYFYQNPNDYTKRANENMKGYVSEMKNIRGMKFFLKLKDKREILVIYAEPENYKEVYDFIRSILPERLASINVVTKYLYN